MNILARGLLLIAIFGPPSLGANPVEPGQSDLELLFGDEATAHLYSPGVEWRPGLETVVWVDRSDDENSILMEVDPVGGSRRALVDDRRLAAAWGDREGDPPTLDDPVWPPDGAAVLVSNGENLSLFNLTAGTLRSLNTGAGAEFHARFSPDGRRIAWVRDNDLWVYDLAQDAEIRLTDDGSETVFNGVLDWVYEEELAGRDGRSFVWADDGSAIAWLRLDDTSLPIHHLIDLMDTHTRVTEQRYPTPGDPSPQPSLHIARFDGSLDPRTTTIDFGPPPPYIPRFGFTPGGDLWYQEIDRPQDHLQLVRVDLENGSRKVLIEESDVYWAEPVDGLHFFDDGSVLWLSRREGFTHLYRIGEDGSFVDLSPGPWDVTAVIGVDPGARYAWYQAARPDATGRRLYRVELMTGGTREITPGPGSHTARLAPSGAKLLITSSSVGSPPRWKIGDGHSPNAAEIPLEQPIPRIDYVDHRFLEVTAEDGLSLNAMLWLPPDFDESQPHPVVVYTYGGPHAQVVRNEWPTTSRLFNHALANHGFVVFALDNRGSAARGRDFEGAADLALGSKQLPDQLAGVAWLKAQPWVDPERIGIWGWSYGGYMTIYALTHAPGVFAAGAAVAPVTDWRLYDSIYTERYMRTPAANPAGYAAGSVLDAVGALHDPLLIIHGTGDDNVHVQHTLQFADRAWREGVRFDLILFPNLAHGINAPGSHLEVFGAIFDFFVEQLMREDAEH